MTPEQQAAANRLAEDLLRVLRTTFFAKLPDKVFWQQRSMLLLGILYPARYLNDRGAMLPAGKYRAIVMNVVRTIKAHGEVRRIERFSAYFAVCVQEHMRHHGDEYYAEAMRLDGRTTTPRPVGQIVERSLRQLQALPAGEAADSVVPSLEVLYSTLKSRGGRKKQVPTAAEQDLFG